VSYEDKGAIQLKVTSQQSINAIHAKADEYDTVRHRTTWRRSSAERIYTAVSHGLRKIIDEPVRHDDLQTYLTTRSHSNPLTKLEQETTMKLIREIVFPLMERDGTLSSSA
jgi:hypothetical protein